MKVLVRVPNWIGDAVLSLTALWEYKTEHPNHDLWVLARPWVADIFEELDWVSGTIPYLEHPGARLMSPRLSLSGLRQLLVQLREESFDRALLFQNSFEAALLAKLAGIPERVGYRLQQRGALLTFGAPVRTRRTPGMERYKRRFQVRFKTAQGSDALTRRGPRDHEVSYYLDLLFQADLISTDYLHSQKAIRSVSIRPSQQGLAKARLLLAEQSLAESSFVLVNPGSAYGSAKRASKVQFGQLIRGIRQAFGLPVAILGWGSERERSREIAVLAGEKVHVLSGEPDLKRTIGLISLSRLMLTNDSGPMHLAAALNQPQVALFGSTDPVTTGPLSPRARVIWKGAHCSPCHLRRCPLDRRCWETIRVDEVLDQMATLLDSRAMMSAKPERLEGLEMGRAGRRL